MATTSELCGEEFVETLSAGFLGDEASRKDDDVRIVVFANEVSYLWLPHQSGTNALMFVECHANALTATTHSDSGIYFASLDAFCQCVSVSGIIATVLGVGAIILVFNGKAAWSLAIPTVFTSIIVN